MSQGGPMQYDRMAELKAIANTPRHRLTLAQLYAAAAALNDLIAEVETRRAHA